MPITLSLELVLSDEHIAAIARQVVELTGGAKRTKPFTPAEAAEAIGMSEATIRRRCQSGVIATISDLGRLMIPASEVERVQEGR